MTHDTKTSEDSGTQKEQWILWSFGSLPVYDSETEAREAANKMQTLYGVEATPVRVK